MKVLSFIGQILFIPHLLLYLFSDSKGLIIEDLKANLPTGLLNNKNVYYCLSFKLMENRWFRTLFYFRLNNILSKFLRIFFKPYHTFIIDVNTQIKGGVRLAHPFATIINAKEIGSNLYINHLVTIGEKAGKKPVIGNNVEIHANAMVLGGITIGDNAIIGAGAVVTKDVPVNAVVVGNPGRVIKILN